MVDFLMISSSRPKKDGAYEISPKFIIKKSKDLMIRGGDFYAVWVEDRGLWSTEEQDAIDIIDKELTRYAEENYEKFSECGYHIKYMWDAESGSINKWHTYCQKQMRDNFCMLDEKLIFANDPVNKLDYASKRLPYSLEKGDISAYDKLMSVLYSPEERHKLEWAIGSIVSGDSKTVQKFEVLYGSHGTGKSTVLNIIQKLFDGYYTVFDAKALGSANSQFALEAFKTNPLVAIQHDGNLSKIEDNTRLNSLVSHELMTINEKFKSTYTSSFKAFLFMGTNNPVKITDAKSGLIRRLIDVSPTGDKVPISEYKRLISQIDFELGAIAKYCLDIYLSDPGKYDNYVPINMMGASNDFYNFVEDNYHIFVKEEGTSLKSAWELYKNYCEDARVPYPYSQRLFKEELKNYFKDYKEIVVLEDGTRIRNYYSNFIINKFAPQENEEKKEDTSSHNLIEFNCTESIFDKECAKYPAQYASDKGTPIKKWKDVKTTLSDLDTRELHYVKLPEENHIVIDFDITDENGNKSFEKNLEAASKWPPTYAELSKSGAGIHLHYIYTGDANALSRIYAENIEIKVFTGNSSLRRKLSKCNNLPISKISSGLPMKGEGKVINFESVKNEKHLRALIKKNLNKEIHPGTKPSVDFIFKLLEDAYESGMNYDVTDLRNAVFGFAANSTHQADYCIKLVNKMHFRSEEYSESVKSENPTVLFYDVEVFPNLFIICWKAEGEGKSVVRMINPKPHSIEELMQFKLVGFNCRKYDNHILYAAMMGYSNEALYNLSQSIIEERKGFFGEAYNISYTDIYDFAAKKQSLKKWEIELGIHHQELGLPWDKPVPEDMWEKVADYCVNDVVATEAVYHHLKGDFTARQILAELAGMTVNDTTNSLTTRIIFGKNKHPQNQFNYRNMGEVSSDDTIPEGFDEYTRFNKKGQPIFPGYEYNEYTRKSSYRGEDPSEGGYVYAEPGMYGNVALLDVASLHPSSVINEQHFGPYTQRFADIKQARIYIKHKEFDNARHMLDGALAPYLDDESTAKQLAQALKIAINSVYGLTSARFENPFKDPRNIDNIVAKRGALFMINLKYEVQKRGFTVVHIKTDSIKIADATPEIIQFVMDYGKMYGYDFEHEDTYDRICLVNDAVYIAKSVDGHWTATGAQFQVPYVFKTLFTKEPIEFEDMCETKSVSKGALYLDMNEKYPDVTHLEKERDKLRKMISDPKRINEPMEFECKRVEELTKEIDAAHDYYFIGRVGQFTPIKSGCGGGVLYRMNEGKYYAATGSKGYRWLESESVKTLQKEDDIDKSYYDKLVDDAASNISFYGDLEWFVSDDPYIGPPIKDGRPVYLDYGNIDTCN